MATLTLQRMAIRNFKGVKNIEIDFGERLTAIKGRNASGKSTICDAWNWVLFNKDSHGNAPDSDNFREKPCDDEGNEIHNLDTEVELTMTLDGAPFNIRRVQRENWVKQRGASNPTYKGNVSTYFINDVETKLKDFQTRIAQIFGSEDWARVIGTLGAFNAMHWKDRRKILLDMAGADVDEQLLEHPEYAPIAREIDERGVSPDNLKKVIADQRKRTANELNMIPVRIDECARAKPSVTPRELKDAQYMIEDCEKTIATVDEQIAAIRAGNASDSGANELFNLQRELMATKREMSDELRRKRMDASDQSARASERYRATGAQIARLKTTRQHDVELAENATKLCDELRKEWMRMRNTKPDTSEATCPTCGQLLPPDQAQQMLDEMNANRKLRMDEVQKQGCMAKQNRLAAEDRIARADVEIAELEAQMQEAAAERDSAAQAYAQMPEEPDYNANPRIVELANRIDELHRSGETGIKSDTREIMLGERKNELKAAIAKAQETVAKAENAKTLDKRIAELEAEQREKGAMLTDLEQLTMLIEKFITNRCAMLEININSLFDTLSWKLFDIQINGGITDCCICMIPCESGLVAYESANTASQINADIEIVDTISKVSGTQMPLFVDNAERVLALAKTDSQLITLSVSTDKELKVVHGQAKQF